jgi:hypothetical protein
MSRDHDDSNPLAGVDLHAWSPPPPPADQVDAILARLDGTRTDAAPAVEPMAPPRPVSRRRRAAWIAGGVLLAAAAAVVIALAAGVERAADPTHEVTPRPTAPDPVLRPGASAPRPPPPPPAPPAPPANIAPTAFEQLRIAGDKQITPDDETKTEIGRDAKAKVVASFKLCLDTTGAISDIKTLKASGYPAYDDKLTRTIRDTWKYLPYLVNGTPTPVCTAVTFIYSQRPGACDAKGLLDEARDAGGLNQWKRMQQKAAESDACEPSRLARQLELLASCRLGDKDAAAKLFPEFRTNLQLRQVCVGVVPDADPP